MSASADLTADDWIFDAYFMRYPQFRKHLMRFVALGKPVICVLWATDPAWHNYARYPTAASVMSETEDQFRACMEFNVSTGLFAVAGPHGSNNSWLGVDTPEMFILRN